MNILYFRRWITFLVTLERACRLFCCCFFYSPAAPASGCLWHFRKQYSWPRGKSDEKGEHSLRIVPLAVKFAVPQKAGVPERVPARRAPHTLLVPEAVGDSEQESVCDRPAASGAHWPLVHVCSDGETLLRPHTHTVSSMEHATFIINKSATSFFFCASVFKVTKFELCWAMSGIFSWWKRFPLWLVNFGNFPPTWKQSPKHGNAVR